MKFYFAGSFNRKPELQEYIKELNEEGHTCTSTWLVQPHEADVSSVTELAQDGPAFQFATEDIADILDADALVFFSSADHEAKGRGGRHTEFGIAWQAQKPIFLIGRRENAFHSLVPDERMFFDFRSFIQGLGLVEAIMMEYMPD